LVAFSLRFHPHLVAQQISMSMPMVDKPSVVAMDVLTSLQDLRHELSTEESDILCNSLQKYLARVEKVCHRRGESAPRILNEQTIDKEQVSQQNLQIYPPKAKTHANLQQTHLQAARHVTQGLPFRMIVADQAPKEVSKASCGNACNDSECTPAKIPQRPKDEAVLKNVRPKADQTTRDVPGQAQFFEIMSFKTIKEIDCESEESEDDWNELQATNQNSIVATCALDLITPSTSAESPQVSTDMLGAGFEDIHPHPSTQNSDTNPSSMQPRKAVTLHKDAITFKKDRGEGKAATCSRAHSGNTFMKRMRERLFNHDDLTDTVDVMGMAIL
jgi:hypothetical protein